MTPRLMMLDTSLQVLRQHVAFRHCGACAGCHALPPPILIGASDDRMLRLTARYADLWNGLVDARTLDRFASYAAIRARIDQSSRRLIASE